MNLAMHWLMCRCPSCHWQHASMLLSQRQIRQTGQASQVGTAQLLLGWRAAECRSCRSRAWTAPQKVIMQGLICPCRSYLWQHASVPRRQVLHHFQQQQTLPGPMYLCPRRFWQHASAPRRMLLHHSQSCSAAPLLLAGWLGPMRRGRCLAHSNRWQHGAVSEREVLGQLRAAPRKVALLHRQGPHSAPLLLAGCPGPQSRDRCLAHRCLWQLACRHSSPLQATSSPQSLPLLALWLLSSSADQKRVCNMLQTYWSWGNAPQGSNLAPALLAWPAAVRNKRKLSCASLLGAVVPAAQVPAMQLRRDGYSSWLSLSPLLLQPPRHWWTGSSV